MTSSTASISLETLDQLFSRMPTGSVDRAILNSLRGLNHRQVQSAVPSNKDTVGLTLFTRPQLNMQTDNIRNIRQMSQLLSNDGMSMQSYIRAVLDPRLSQGFSMFGIEYPALDCPLMDPYQAFIPCFTNNYLSQSGWPSISVPTFTSKAGLYNETFSMVDGVVLNHGDWDLNVNFRNTRGDAVLYLLYTWVLYMSLVFEGRLVPYMDFMTENELDYNTRVYRLVLDAKKQKVVKIAATHAGFPIGVPVGDAFNDPGGIVYSEANKEIGVTFRCTGVDYFDAILVKEFNETVECFNANMMDDYRDASMIAVPYSDIELFNFSGYPRIDPVTTELKWYVYLEHAQQVYTRRLRAMSQYNSNEEIGA